MKNYILMLGIAGVALGTYAAYAGNSATMTVTATIEHDVSLSVTQNLSLGTITINPAYTATDIIWHYSDSGIYSLDNHTLVDSIVSADNATVGTFTANIPNPSACDGTGDVCGGLRVTQVTNLFGGNDNSNACNSALKYSGSRSSFKVYFSMCYIDDISKVTTGSHSATLTISYTPS
ncbi:MAG: hypothetical protein IJ689_00080 [Alphaproteobacteria bacterium]|nr:hypothetical protein [Alphaproteobacteria bacterium]